MTAPNVTNYQTNFQSIVAEGFRTGVPTAFLQMFMQRMPILDLGITTATIESWLNDDEVAPMVSFLTAGRDEAGNVMTPGTAGAGEYLFGLTEQEYNISKSNLLKRIPGEIYVLTAENPEDIETQRGAYWATKLGMECLKKVMRRLELLAQESFLTGEMTIVDQWQGQNKLVFPRSSALKNRTVEAVWSNASTANPWADYGEAQKQIIKDSGAIGSASWFSVLSDSAYGNLKAIYREQAKSVDTGNQAVVKDTELSRDLANMPSSLKFLVDGGMEYGGMVRSDFSASYIHLFTYPVFYSDAAGDKTEYFSGNSVPLCAYDADIFQAYFGSGSHMDTTGDGLEMLGLGSVDAVAITGDVTIGNVGVPAMAVHHTIAPTPDKRGVNGFIEVSTILANRICNRVATIDTATAT